MIVELVELHAHPFAIYVVALPDDLEVVCNVWHKAQHDGGVHTCFTPSPRMRGRASLWRQQAAIQQTCQ